MAKYWWIIRTDDNCGLPYDTFVKWYNIPKLIYWIIRYKNKNINFWFTFTWVDMDSPIGEETLYIKYIQRSRNNENKR